MYHGPEAPVKTQDTLETQHLLKVLGTLRVPPRGAAGSGWVEGSLGILA